MLSFNIDHSETQITVTGTHSNPADDPPNFAWTPRIHPLRTDYDTIVADLEAYLAEAPQSRTGATVG